MNRMDFSTWNAPRINVKLIECYISHKSLSSRTKYRTQRKHDF